MPNRWFKKIFWQRQARKTASPTGKKRRGATAVEMALIAPVFFLFMIGLTEIALVITAQQLIENASYSASRLAKTGYVANGMTQSQTIMQVVTNELAGFGTMFDPSKITTNATAYNTFSSIGGTGGVTGYGTQQQIIVYTITYPWKIFTPMMGQIIGTWDAPTTSWVLYLSTRIVVRNEPYG